MKFVLSAFTSFCIFISISASAQSLADFSWKTGQVIAISEPLADPTTLFFEAGTGSRFGHVGVIVVVNKEVRVYESDPRLDGTGYELIKDFITRSQVGTGDYAYTILEPAVALTDAQLQQLATKVDQLAKSKIPYNFSQTYISDGSKLSCSEFVASVFKSIGLTNVGQIETIKDAVNLSAFNGGLAKLNDMVGGPPFPKPENQILSPLSVVMSPALKVVQSTLPTQQTLSDQEIYDAWLKGDGFTALVAIRAMVMDPSVTPYEKLQSIKKSNQIGPMLPAMVKQLTDLLQSGGPLSQKPFRSFPNSWRRDNCIELLKRGAS